MSREQAAGAISPCIPTDETPGFVEPIFLAHFPERAPEFFRAVFREVQNLFAGNYPGYQACDTAFHDLAHTFHATVATVRLLDGHLKGGNPPNLSALDFELAVAGILLHDSGFIKRTGDNDGTGAKYIVTHVARSAELAAEFLPPLGVASDKVRIVQLAIRSTGVNVDTSRLQFRDERERFLGCALGTGDILGQMAAPDYPERLPALYREYVEGVAYSKLRDGGIASYKSVKDLLRRTREFYDRYVKQMLDTQWAGVHRCLHHHFPDGRNHYLDAIEINLKQIDQLLNRPTTRATS
jgi:hypothetical protein